MSYPTNKSTLAASVFQSDEHSDDSVIRNIYRCVKSVLM